MPNAIFFYRLARWCHRHHIPILPKIFQLIIFIVYNSKITADSKIGRGTYLVCKGIGTVIIPGTIIGEKCTLGLRFSTVRIFPYKNVPQIGDNVWIGPNVVVAGPVIIEDNAVIIANSYLTNSVPSGAIVSGNPAKIVGWRKDLPYEINDNPKYQEGSMPYLSERKKDYTILSPRNNDRSEIIIALIAKCLQLPREVLTGIESIQDLAEWDSLSNLSIIKAMEDFFDIKIPSEDIFRLTSIPAFIDYIEEHDFTQEVEMDFDRDLNPEFISHSPILLSVYNNARTHPSKTALILNNHSITYASLIVNIRKMASYLSLLDLKTGDTILLAGDKSLEFVYLYLGAHMIGLRSVIVDPKSKKDRVAFIVSKAMPKYCFGSKIQNDIPGTMLDEIIYVNQPLYVPKKSPITPDSIAEILFTTGTTGEPKGVCLSFNNIANSAVNINKFIGNTSNDIEIIGLPLCHSFGLGRLRCNLIKGSTVVFIDGFSNVALLFDMIEKYNVTGIAFVPAAWAYIQKVSGDRIGKYSGQIRYIEIGSASMSLEVKKTILKLFPDTRICMHYGSTEASRSCFIEFHDSEHLDSIGRATSDSISIMICDKNGESVNVGVIGEICIKGNMVMSAYINADSLEKTFFNGYFRTGDMGYKDKDGYFHLVGREKEVINVGGKKVSPIEVEDAICSLGVVDCVCVPMKDENDILGEVVKCYILKNGTSLSFEEIDNRLVGLIESYKRPVKYDWIDEIPKTDSGKKQRLNIR